jgi:hypothetical protein
VQTSSAHTNTLAVHASQSREAIDGVIERVLARSLFPNIPMRKAAPTVYFYGARRVVITESGNPAMPHVKSGRFDGSLEDFFAQVARFSACVCLLMLCPLPEWQD